MRHFFAEYSALMVMKSLIIFVCLLITGLSVVGESTARTVDSPGRLLADFTDSATAKSITRTLENGSMEATDSGGDLAVPSGQGWTSFDLTPKMIRDWASGEAVSLDVDAESAGAIALELWDDASRDYATRCTFEQVVRAGAQTLTWRIDLPRRNRREALDRSELQPGDLISLPRLQRVKIIVTRHPQKTNRLRLGSLRLLSAADLHQPLGCEIPAGWFGFDFGATRPAIGGLQAVQSWTRRDATNGFGFSATQLQKNGGSEWPDPFAGTYVLNAGEQESQFEATIPNGAYLALVGAGRFIRPDSVQRRFYLRLADRVLCDASPTIQEMCDTNYLYRFMDTAYSPAPHALWFNYIDRMYPFQTVPVTVTNGILRVTMCNHFISGLILAPAVQSNAMNTFSATLRALRLARFERGLPAVMAPVPESKDMVTDDFDLYVPDAAQVIRPWTRPTALERTRCNLAGRGTPGGNVFMRLALVPRRPWCVGRLQLDDLAGPAVIKASAFNGYRLAYRWDGVTMSEMALMPGLEFAAEAGVTQGFWLWLRIPPESKPGRYTGEFTLQVQGAEPVSIGVGIDVQPFTLEPVLPVAFGMYYSEPAAPSLPPGVRTQRLREQVEWMRQIGFTALPVGAPRITGVDAKAGNVDLEWDSFWFDLARQAGMGRHPDQRLMANQLNLARSLGKRFVASGQEIDRDPGLELRIKPFMPLYLDMLKKYKKLLDRFNMPVAVEVVDEPREMPNPWNRNLKDTLAYADCMRKAGIPTFVTVMQDRQSGLDYTALADAVDITSTHGGQAGDGLMKKASAQNRALWLYNLGMDRLTWGFYVWRTGARGRWEWHFCWPEDRATGDYPGREWYNPFTGLHGLAPSAPSSRFPGAMVFQSVFCDVAEGITDYSYAMTLEKAIRIELAKKNGEYYDAAVAASNLLMEIRETIPLHLDESRVNASSFPLDAWRTRIAEFLATLAPITPVRY